LYNQKHRATSTNEHFGKFAVALTMYCPDKRPANQTKTWHR